MQRREADQERKRQNRAVTCGAYRVADQQRMAYRRSLEWIRVSEAWQVFRYEISDLFSTTLTYCQTVFHCKFTECKFILSTQN